MLLLGGLQRTLSAGNACVFNLERSMGDNNNEFTLQVRFHLGVITFGAGSRRREMYMYRPIGQFTRVCL